MSHYIHDLHIYFSEWSPGYFKELKEKTKQTKKTKCRKNSLFQFLLSFFFVDILKVIFKKNIYIKSFLKNFNYFLLHNFII